MQLRRERTALGLAVALAMSALAGCDDGPIGDYCACAPPELPDGGAADAGELSGDAAR